MNQSKKLSLFPWLTLLAGGIGLALRAWLFSNVDNQGLLPENHIAGILCFLLLAGILAVSFWAARKEAPSNAYRKLFPPSAIAAIGTALAAIGMGFSAFTIEAAGFLRILVMITGVLGAAALLYTAYCRFIGLRPSCLLHVAFAIYLVFRVMVFCRHWGAETQIQVFFFQLLGSLFLLITGYYRAEADAIMGDYRKYLFFSQAALFCCCLCLVGSDRLFYLSAALWLIADTCTPPRHA